jgi:hypothetical protein
MDNIMKKKIQNSIQKNYTHDNVDINIKNKDLFDKLSPRKVYENHRDEYKEVLYFDFMRFTYASIP